MQMLYAIAIMFDRSFAVMSHLLFRYLVLLNSQFSQRLNNPDKTRFQSPCIWARNTVEYRNCFRKYATNARLGKITQILWDANRNHVCLENGDIFGDLD